MLAPLRLAVLVATVVLVCPAVAQDLQLGPALDLGTLGVTVATGEATRQMFRQGGGRGASPARKKASSASLAYRPNPTVRKRVVESFVRATTQNDPAGAQKMRALFARQDPIAYLNRELGKYGLRPNSLASGLSVYLVQSWYGAHGKTAGSPGEYGAVARQAADVFASNPALARANDATKQEAAESLMLYGALFEDAIKEAKKSQPTKLTQLRTIIAFHARNTLGFDLNALRLGARGFY